MSLQNHKHQNIDIGKYNCIKKTMQYAYPCIPPHLAAIITIKFLMLMMFNQKYWVIIMYDLIYNWFNYACIHKIIHKVIFPSLQETF